MCVCVSNYMWEYYAWVLSKMQVSRLLGNVNASKVAQTGRGSVYEAQGDAHRCVFVCVNERGGKGETDI